MENQKMPEYETIRAAVAGEKDMRQSITKKLIEALPQFPLEEMEKGNVR